jgi:hypothetical protein
MSSRSPANSEPRTLVGYDSHLHWAAVTRDQSIHLHCLLLFVVVSMSRAPHLSWRNQNFLYTRGYSLQSTFTETMMMNEHVLATFSFEQQQQTVSWLNISYIPYNPFLAGENVLRGLTIILTTWDFFISLVGTNVLIKWFADSATKAYISDDCDNGKTKEIQKMKHQVSRSVTISRRWEGRRSERCTCEFKWMNELEWSRGVAVRATQVSHDARVHRRYMPANIIFASTRSSCWLLWALLFLTVSLLRTSSSDLSSSAVLVQCWCYQLHFRPISSICSSCVW